MLASERISFEGATRARLRAPVRVKLDSAKLPRRLTWTAAAAVSLGLWAAAGYGAAVLFRALAG